MFIISLLNIKDVLLELRILMYTNSILFFEGVIAGV